MATFINCLFATVELIAKTTVDVGQVGVVVWYAGKTGTDLSGVDYKHGELLKRGERGVWSEPLMPGKYPFNTYAGKVILVPTTNIILKWIHSEAGSHRFDENLAEVSLITKDAFEPSLPLSVVIHIDYRKAPLVIQRFGDIRRLGSENTNAAKRMGVLRNGFQSLFLLPGSYSARAWLGHPEQGSTAIGAERWLQVIDQNQKHVGTVFTGQA